MPARFLFGHVPSRCHSWRSWPLEMPIGANLALGRLWGGFAEAWGSFWSFRINLGRLWETLGDSGGAFGEALGGFGELWETLGESLGSLWEALGKLWEPFRAFLLLAPSLPPLYIRKNKTPDQPLQRPHIIINIMFIIIISSSS